MSESKIVKEITVRLENFNSTEIYGKYKHMNLPTFAHIWLSLLHSYDAPKILFICDLFNDAVIRSGCTESNDRIFN
jgi:hypothetical protein